MLSFDYIGWDGIPSELGFGPLERCSKFKLYQWRGVDGGLGNGVESQIESSMLVGSLFSVINELSVLYFRFTMLLFLHLSKNLCKSYKTKIIVLK